MATASAIPRLQRFPEGFQFHLRRGRGRQALAEQLSRGDLRGALGPEVGHRKIYGKSENHHGFIGRVSIYAIDHLMMSSNWRCDMVM